MPLRALTQNLGRLVPGFLKGASSVDASKEVVPDVPVDNVLAQKNRSAAQRSTLGFGGVQMGEGSPMMRSVSGSRAESKDLKRARAAGLVRRAPQGVKLAPNFLARAQQAMDYKNKVRQHGEFWKMGFGDYANDLYPTSHIPSRENQRELIGLEKRFAEQIDALLSTGKRPVVAVDFGGMYGLSFLRLAGHFKNEIAQGALALVVTNLGFTLEHGLSTVGRGMNDLTNEEAALIHANRHLVHYVQADAEELLDREITLPNGSRLRLEGQVDLLHEDFALCHSQRPDMDLPLLGQSLSEIGLLFLGSSGAHARGSDDDRRGRDRKKAYRLGLQTLNAQVPELHLGQSSKAVFARNPALAKVQP